MAWRSIGRKVAEYCRSSLVKESLLMAHHACRSGLAVALAAVLSIAAVQANNLPPLPSDESTSSITAVDLRRHLSFLASDELGGRYTLSPSSRIAARYLASQLES